MQICGISTLPLDVTPSEYEKNVETSHDVSEIDEFGFWKLPERPRQLSTDGDRLITLRSSDEKSFASLQCFSPQISSRTNKIPKIDYSHRLPPLPVIRSDFDTRSSAEGHETSPMMSEAWEALNRATLYFHGYPVGTIAAMDSSEDKLNYDQVFVRDFVPSALAFLMNEEPRIVKNFLLKTLRFQSSEKKIDRFKLGEGVMPASFKVLHNPDKKKETLIAGFGESAIGRVAPIDSGFWWIILLHAYTKSTGDNSLADKPECQNGMRLILDLCLSEGFDTFPTLLCSDGCCMIDRRMGVYGYPIEIQALFFMALKCALLLLKEDAEGKMFADRIRSRLSALRYHMRNYFWLDLKQLNDVYRYKTEEYSHTAVNKFNVIPDSLPEWIFDFMPTHGGYFIGNVGPSKMDFRWFCLGNCVAILASLATPEQSDAIIDLIESRWEELVGEMPLKVCYPAIEGHEWKILTGCDPKNTRWSYHNGGSWPVLIWLLTAACIKTKRPHIAERAIGLIEQRLSEGFDTFPTLLCADGCCMIDRRMGVYGYPIEIQALFFMALKCALLLLKKDAEGKMFEDRIRSRLSDFMPTHGGYFIRNVGPSKMDSRGVQIISQCYFLEVQMDKKFEQLSIKSQRVDYMKIFKNLPIELREEVVIRLPIQIFTSLIPAEQFIGHEPSNLVMRHLDFVTSKPHDAFVLQTRDLGISYFFVARDSELIHSYQIPHRNDEENRVCGCSKGFVCHMYKNTRFEGIGFHVYNPVLNQNVLLPPPQIPRAFGLENFYSDEDCSFGFIGDTNEFKILRLINIVEAEVYRSSENVWAQLTLHWPCFDNGVVSLKKKPTQPLLLLQRPVTLFANQRFYWVAGDKSYNFQAVVSFDINREIFEIVTTFQEPYSSHLQLGLVGNTLMMHKRNKAVGYSISSVNAVNANAVEWKPYPVQHLYPSSFFENFVASGLYATEVFPFTQTLLSLPQGYLE